MTRGLLFNIWLFGCFLNTIGFAATIPSKDSNNCRTHLKEEAKIINDLSSIDLGSYNFFDRFFVGQRSFFPQINHWPPNTEKTLLDYCHRAQYLNLVQSSEENELYKKLLELFHKTFHSESFQKSLTDFLKSKKEVQNSTDLENFFLSFAESELNERKQFIYDYLTFLKYTNYKILFPSQEIGAVVVYNLIYWEASAVKKILKKYFKISARLTAVLLNSDPVLPPLPKQKLELEDLLYGRRKAFSDHELDRFFKTTSTFIRERFLEDFYSQLTLSQLLKTYKNYIFENKQLQQKIGQKVHQLGMLRDAMEERVQLQQARFEVEEKLTRSSKISGKIMSAKSIKDLLYCKSLGSDCSKVSGEFVRTLKEHMEILEDDVFFEACHFTVSDAGIWEKQERISRFVQDLTEILLKRPLGEAYLEPLRAHTIKMAQKLSSTQIKNHIFHSVKQWRSKEFLKARLETINKNLQNLDSSIQTLSVKLRVETENK